MAIPTPFSANFRRKTGQCEFDCSAEVAKNPELPARRLLASRPGEAARRNQSREWVVDALRLGLPALVTESGLSQCR